MTAEAARRLTDLFNYNIPQRWSIAHLYQAVINGEEHVSRVHFLTTLAGYVHWKLTGKQVLGVGDASGMFPIDPATGQYDAEMLDKFEEMMVPKGYPWKLRDLLPEVLSAGDEAGTLTEEGAKLLDESGNLVDPTKLEERPVTLGRSSSEYIEILDGLEEGETVYVQNIASNAMAMMMGVGG